MQTAFTFPPFSFEKIEKGLTSAFWSLFNSVFKKYNPTFNLILPEKGIRNYGNTCFLNSVLQAFASTPSLRAYMGAVDNSNPSLLKFNKNLKQCMEALRDPSSSSKIDKSAKIIYDQLSKHRRMFGDRNEQDAEECLQALLSMMSIELKEAKKVKDKKSLIIENSLMPPHLPFEGWCSSTITCLKCHHARPKKHQTFVDLSLSLQNLSRSQEQHNLMECLDQYSFQESLSDVECLNCSLIELLEGKETLETMAKHAASKEVNDIIYTINYLDANSHQLDKVADSFPGDERVRTDACKQLKISRLPEVLCLHLSRRFFCARTGCMIKNRCKITFPLHLDMQNHVEADIMSTESVSSLILGKNSKPSNCLYGLRAVIVHHGDANSGHYTTYASLDIGRGNAEMAREDGVEPESHVKQDSSRQCRRWMHFSDEKAVMVTQDEVLNSEAYMLFYDKTVA
mmetsp:Transcript_1135/g.2308  ORF Transcript_1135/g.2308 Transcript_1135/m.2308 type:complete len:455 (+) Transcript_1135:112-1476(+)|eukprot:CAMPEP_0114425748 /NCGR_PEP_ID=MMETSP0103-20121206/7407_1 /TAXON_ID=37642 ORGANISM="Paraphysomonas imperforata, Strain PA2" /NCGR_SAMPLE_ID=MMETSP0103 /ASSEMBLY_ACC=CAM_ASM_000201 /LENGTH=454 /DNA_ID=CAMNT_0001594617 /DNA_START=29 /DNA_END=1393 /DNA_ORIENTATION=+